MDRTRFGDAEKAQLAEALDSQDLWPYQSGGFRTKMRQADEMVRARYSTDERPVWMIPTSSGTSSIHVALGGLQIAAGSEVILPPITDPGTVTPILFNNNIPVFADVDPASSLITPDSVEAVLTPRTSAVIAVHLTGSPADVPGIRQKLEGLGRQDVKIIEDVAQGLGATLDGVRLGTMGDAGCFSLNSQKHISVGEGGFVLVSDEDDFFRCHNYSDKHRNRFGSNKPEHDRYEGPGHSLRMSELHGAMLIAQLPKLDGFAAARNAFGMAADDALSQAGFVPQAHLPGAFPTFFGYMFATQNEHDRQTRLNAAREVSQRIRHLGSSMGLSYNHEDLPIYQYPLFLKRNFFPNAQNLWPAEVVAAQMHEEIEIGHYDYSAVSCPEAESHLKRSFWLRLDETHTPENGKEIAETIIDVFNAQGLS